MEEPLDGGKAEVVGRLYDEVARMAIAKTVALVGQPQIAVEIVQEVFLKLYRNEVVFPRREAAYTWIFKACHNAGLDHLRAARTRRERLEDCPELFVDDATWRLDDRLVTRSELKSLLARLPKSQAELLAYVAVDNMTYEEVGTLLGKSSKTIQRTIARIRERLR